jgi:nucleoside-diphosphate kinase
VLENTLLVIKPDAVKRKLVGEIIGILENEFDIIGIKLTRLNKQQAEDFYAIHKEKEFYSDLVEFMTSGPVVAILLQGDEIQKRLRTFIGITDPSKAEKGTIRAKYGSSVQHNAVHASNPMENPEQELKFYFPECFEPTHDSKTNQELEKNR